MDGTEFVQVGWKVRMKMLERSCGYKSCKNYVVIGTEFVRGVCRGRMVGI